MTTTPITGSAVSEPTPIPPRQPGWGVAYPPWIIADQWEYDTAHTEATARKWHAESSGSVLFRIPGEGEAPAPPPGPSVAELEQALRDMRFAYINKDEDCPHYFEKTALAMCEMLVGAFNCEGKPAAPVGPSVAELEAEKAKPPTIQRGRSIDPFVIEDD